MKTVIGFIVLVCMSIPVSLLGGVVLADLWRWFIEPVFDVPSLNYMQAVGLSLVVGFFHIGLKTGFGSETEEEDRLVSSFATVFGFFLAYLISWGVGAVWHMFM